VSDAAPTTAASESGAPFSDGGESRHLSDSGVSPTFVLSGGGNLGALQVGMMYALFESGLKPGKIVGTSVGAINGAFLASRPDLPGITEIARLWSSLRRRDVLGMDFATLVGGIRGRPRHLFDATSIRRILDSFLTFRRLEDAPIPLTVVATALRNGEAVVLSSGDATTAVLAQVAMLQEQATSCPADAHGDQPVVRVIPPPELHIPMARLDQSENLVRLGYEQAMAWLEGRPPPETSRHGRRSSPRFAYRPPIELADQSS
jgi:hypothetical protein